MIYIVAGSYREAEYLASRRGLSRREFRVITDSHNLRGSAPVGVTVLFYANWRRLRDAREIMELVRVLGYEYEEVTDGC